MGPFWCHLGVIWGVILGLIFGHFGVPWGVPGTSRIRGPSLVPEVAKKMKKPAWVFDARSIINTDLVKKSGINMWSLGDGSSQDDIGDF